MPSGKYQELVEIKRKAVVEFRLGAGVCALCPDMGGRVFGELNGLALHRIDLAAVRAPNRPFNNFGGGNFWPAPEGGPFGFNYCGNEWFVQACINNQPFQIQTADARSACLQKKITLLNRAGCAVPVEMRRAFRIEEKLPDELQQYELAGFLAYQTEDSFAVLEDVGADKALLASWTLEQFDANERTISFGVVENPELALNFDFYEHPGGLIAYHKHGFTYQTNGRRKGQIGIRRAAAARRLGFYDESRRLVCLRENCAVRDGVYFNIADNDQKAGPYAAADNYSIFNSDPDMAAFELETIGPAILEGGLLKGSELVSRTIFVMFREVAALRDFIERMLGCSREL